MAAIGVSAGDTSDLDSAGSIVKTMGSGAVGLHALKGCAKTYAQSIDPRLEDMSPEDILAAGKAVVGNKRSPFIDNPSIITPKDWSNSALITHAGLLTGDELTSFYNLLGVLHQQQAQTALDYRTAPTAANRMKAAHLNAEIGTIPSVMLVHACVKKPGLREDAKNGAMDMAALRKHYPNLCRSIPLIQKIDDQADIALDLLEEIRTGRPTPNYIVAKAHQLGGLTHESGRLTPAIAVQMHHTYDKGASRMPVESLPASLVRGLEATDREFREEAATFNPLTRKLLLTGWEHGLKNGIKPAANERIDPLRTTPALGRA